MWAYLHSSNYYTISEAPGSSPENLENLKNLISSLGSNLGPSEFYLCVYNHSSTGVLPGRVSRLNSAVSLTLTKMTVNSGCQWQISSRTSQTLKCAVSLLTCSMKMKMVSCMIGSGKGSISRTIAFPYSTPSVNYLQWRIGTPWSSMEDGCLPQLVVVVTSQRSQTTLSTSLILMKMMMEMGSVPVSSLLCKRIVASRRKWEYRSFVLDSLCTRYAYM